MMSQVGDKITEERYLTKHSRIPVNTSSYEFKLPYTIHDFVTYTYYMHHIKEKQATNWGEL